MAALTVFHFIHRGSPLHKLDARAKLVCMVLFSVSASLASTRLDFTILTLTLLIALLVAQLPIITLLKELRYFSLLIVPVAIVHAFAVPGTPVAGFPIPGLTIEGINSGLVFAWRLVLIVVICVILTGTTSLSSLSNAIEWFLRPIPFVPASRVATMINLTFVFIPLVFDQASEMLTAQRARCIEGRRNPVKRISFIAFPLLTDTFRRTDEMVMAMEARCYCEDRTRAALTMTTNDWLAIVASALVSSLVFFMTF